MPTKGALRAMDPADIKKIKQPSNSKPALQLPVLTLVNPDAVLGLPENKGPKRRLIPSADKVVANWVHKRKSPVKVQS